MDPNACLAEIASLSATADGRNQERRRELCEALRGWLDRGGFQPDWKACPHGAATYRRWQSRRSATARLIARMGGAS